MHDSCRFMRIALLALALGLALAIGCGDDENPPDGLLLPPDILIVNELLAINHTTIADPADSAYDDWLELWNPGPDSASTRALYLTDDFSQPRRFPLPDTTLPPGGHLLLWLDNETAQGRWHAPFRLNGTGGEQAGVFASQGSATMAVDTVSFGVQQPDISFARIPDGGAFTFDPTPTPGSANIP
jgi:hypothetical protein